jgi:hypothetical protein
VTDQTATPTTKAAVLREVAAYIAAPHDIGSDGDRMQVAGVPDYLRGLADNLDPKETKMTETAAPDPECPTCLHLVSLHPVSPHEGVCEGATGPAECDCCWTRAEARREARAKSAPEEPVSVPRGALDLGEINRLAADCAAGPENRVGTIFRLATQTVPALTARIAELEENVRALGGDPDRMVDPRDHEAAITDYVPELPPAGAGADEGGKS